MANKMTYESGFAVLDVKRGRAALRRRLAKGERVRVLIEAEFDSASSPRAATFSGNWKPWSSDDGISQEFELHVRQITEL